MITCTVTLLLCASNDFYWSRFHYKSECIRHWLWIKINSIRLCNCFGVVQQITDYNLKHWISHYLGWGGRWGVVDYILNATQLCRGMLWGHGANSDASSHFSTCCFLLRENRFNKYIFSSKFIQTVPQPAAHCTSCHFGVIMKQINWCHSAVLPVCLCTDEVEKRRCSAHKPPCRQLRPGSHLCISHAARAAQSSLLPLSGCGVHMFSRPIRSLCVSMCVDYLTEPVVISKRELIGRSWAAQTAAAAVICSSVGKCHQYFHRPGIFFFC